MPLPSTDNFALLPHQSSSDAKPNKQAILMRMSTESLDALQEHLSDLKFDFGDNNPGILIGKTFFPMRLYRENNPHELYLRSLHPSVKVNNLKLHANVIGKFIVDRELGEKSESKVRESTIRAAQEKSTPKTILTDPLPQSLINPAKKRKPLQKPAMFRKPYRSSEQTPLPVATVRQPSTTGSPPLRQRLVHCLALGNKTIPELHKLFEEVISNRRILEEVATPVNDGDQQPSLWQLKSASWREIRPYDWPGYTNTERATVLRSARTMLKTLSIMPDDPLWVHFRPTSTSSHESPPSSRSNEARNPIESSDLSGASLQAKEKMVEGHSLHSKNNAPRNTGSKPTPSVHSRPSLATRKPGSGFKVVRPHSPASQDPSTSSRGKIERDMPQAGPSKLSESSEQSSHDLSQIRSRHMLPQNPDGNKNRAAKSQTGQGGSSLLKQEVTQDEDIIPRLKRKGLARPSDLPPQDAQHKRRKLANESETSDTHDGKRRSQQTLPKKPEYLPQKPKDLKRESPLPAIPPNHKSQTALPRSSGPPINSGRTSHKAKRSRRSLSMYTSSDEDDSRLKGTVTSSSRSSSSSQALTPLGLVSIPSTDHASLRAKYGVIYVEYLNKMQVLVGQINRMDAILRKDDTATTEPRSDSEGDVGLMDMDRGDIDRLTAEHRLLQDKLMSIRQVFTPGSQDFGID